LQICKKLPLGIECEVLRKQLFKAGTSIGANYEEADGALTKKDFINKVAIARKEAKETKYWLRMVNEEAPFNSNIRCDIREAEEIICILSAILKKSGYKFRL
jgi:four helix bundle protein